MDGLCIRSDLDETVFAAAHEIWLLTGITKPERGDTMASVEDTLAWGGTFLTAWLEDRCVGTCWCSTDNRRIYLHHMATHPDYQNRGIGHRLMESALDFAVRKGLQVKLEVHRDNPGARHLYEKYGFTVLDGYESLILRGLPSP